MSEIDNIVAAVLATGFCNENLHQPTHDDFMKQYQEFLLRLNAAPKPPSTTGIIDYYERKTRKQG